VVVLRDVMRALLEAAAAAALGWVSVQRGRGRLPESARAAYSIASLIVAEATVLVSRLVLVQQLSSRWTVFMLTTGASWLLAVFVSLRTR